MGNLEKPLAFVRIQVVVAAAVMVIVLAVFRFRPHIQLAAAIGAVD